MKKGRIRVKKELLNSKVRESFTSSEFYLVNGKNLRNYTCAFRTSWKLVLLKLSLGKIGNFKMICNTIAHTWSLHKSFEKYW